MIKSEIALLFKNIYDESFKPNEISKIFKSIENDLEKIDFSSIPNYFIAPYIHHLFLTAIPSTKSFLFKFICEMDLNSTVSIIEKFEFDKLIALSLEPRTLEVVQKVDEEKLAAFRCVSLLLKFRHKIPNSIIRALISLYYFPKHGYKSLIVSYLLELSLNNSNIENIPEVGQLFIDYLHETGSSSIVNLIDYSVENRFQFIFLNHFSSKFISPFSQLKSKPIENSEIICQSLIKIFRCWSSFLCLGISQRLIEYLIQCLPHSTDSVILIFSSLLNLNNINSVSNGYTGLLLYTLVHFGLINILNELASINENAYTFLNNILPYTTQNETKNIDLSKSIFKSKINIPISLNSIHSIKTIKYDSNPENVTSIINFNLSNDISSWDWRNINKILTVILPHNEIEAKSQQARNFFIKLLDIFSGPLLNSSTMRTSLIIEVLESFLSFLLISKQGWQQVENHQGLKNTFELVLTKLEQSESIETLFSYKALFKFISLLMNKESGIKTLQIMNLTDKIINLGLKCSNLYNVEFILSNLQLYPNYSLSIELYRNFLNSNFNGVHNIAINYLKIKKSTT